MKMTLTAIKADIGTISGNSHAVRQLVQTVSQYLNRHGVDSLLDHYIGHNGNNIAIATSHRQGCNSNHIHALCWHALTAGIEADGNNSQTDSGNQLNEEQAGTARPTGASLAELEFDERPDESFLLFAADKSVPGCYNLPLYTAFADPMNTPGLMHSAEMSAGFRFTIKDLNHTDGDLIIELSAPDELYTIAALLHDSNRFVVDSIRPCASTEPVASVSTSRPTNLADGNSDKHNPIMLVRVQNRYPATGEILAPYAIDSHEAFRMRGSGQTPLMPVTLNSGVAYIDGLTAVSCAAIAVKNGRFTEAVDTFAHPFWNRIREGISSRASGRRRQSLALVARIPAARPDYSNKLNLKSVQQRFSIRNTASADYGRTGYRSLDVF